MKSILAALVMILATVANTSTASANATNTASQTKQLQCGDESSFNKFTAILDYSNFDPTTGFFNVTDAYIEVGYALASLQCAGHTLSELTCIGFWFNEHDMIVKVATETHNGNITYSHNNLTKAPVAEASAIPCTLK